MVICSLCQCLSKKKLTDEENSSESSDSRSTSEMSMEEMVRQYSSRFRPPSYGWEEERRGRELFVQSFTQYCEIYLREMDARSRATPEGQATFREEESTPPAYDGTLSASPPAYLEEVADSNGKGIWEDVSIEYLDHDGARVRNHVFGW